MSIIVQTFIKCAVRIPEKITYGNGMEQTEYIVATPFSCTRYVNDAEYRVEYRSLVANKRLPPRQNNVNFEQTLCPNSSLN